MARSGGTSSSSGRRSSSRRSTRQGKLTPELEARIRGTFDPAALEDLYLPYKQKRKTKAQIAREAGLEPLADWLWACGHGADRSRRRDARGARGRLRRRRERNRRRRGARWRARPTSSSSGCRRTPACASQVRTRLLRARLRRARARARRRRPPSQFENYFDYQEPIAALLKPASLAPLPGDAARLDGGGAGADARRAARRRRHAGERPAARRADRRVRGRRLPAAGAAFAGAPLLKRAARLALRAHVAPSIETEVHKALRDVADARGDQRVRRERPQAAARRAVRTEGGARRRSGAAHRLQAGGRRRDREVRRHRR